MNKTIDKLWELIHVLSISEKRYFKVYANKHATVNKNNYIRLFDIINKQKTYDDDAIRAYFKEATFLKQLHVTKHYLYQLILKSLRSYHAEKSVDSKVFSYFQDIELLFDKGLMNQCKREINKAKAYMKSQDKTLDLFRLAQWEDEVSNELHKHASNKTLTASLEEDQNLLKKVVNLSKYKQLNTNLYYIIRQKDFGVGKRLEKIEKYLKHPLLQNIEQALTFHAKLIYYEIYSLCYDVTYNWTELETSTRLGLELLDTRPKYRNNNMYFYLKFMARYCVVLNKSSTKRDLFFKAMDQLNQLSIKERPLRLKAELLYYDSLSLYYGDRGDQKNGLLIVQKMEIWLSDNKDLKGDYKLILLDTMVDIYFMADDFSKSLDCLNKILNLENSSIRRMTERYFRLKLLIVYIELGYWELLEYSICSFFRLLTKDEHAYEVEKLFVRFLQKELSYSISARDAQKKCACFLDSFEKKIEGVSNEWEFVLSWLESKSAGRTYVETVRQKYKKEKEGSKES